MKRIVFVNPASDLYGASKILLNTINAFEDYERHVIVPEEGLFTDILNRDIPGVRVHILPSLPVIAKKNLTPKGIFSFCKNIIAFRSEINKLIAKDDVLYINTLAVLPTALCGTRNKILHIHEILPSTNILNRIVNKLAFKAANTIVCVSQATADSLLTERPKNYSGNVHVVHNGIAPIDITKRNSAADAGPKIRIVLVGRIKPEIKGQNYVLDALNELPEKTKDRIEVKFYGSTVPGQEHHLAEVLDKIKDYKLANVVSIIGFTKDVSSIYENADICLVPSVRADPFPTTVLEAMSCSLPVIGTDLGGIPEMIDDGETGYLIPRNEPKKFANRLGALIDNPELRKIMGEKGKKKFNSMFSIADYENRLKSALHF